jgi:hypothetical protein
MVVFYGLLVEKGEKYLVIRLSKEVEVVVYGTANVDVGSYVELRCIAKKWKNRLIFLIAGGENA